MSLLIREEKTQLLLVEGEDDKVFFEGYLEHFETASETLTYGANLEILTYRGRDGLSNILRELRNSQNIRNILRIGIVRDSDFGTDALQSVLDRIRTINRRSDRQFGVPEHAIPSAGGMPSLSLLILPSTQREGMLEDVVLDALKADPISTCVDDFFDCLDENNVVVDKEKRPKARVRTFLIAKNVASETKVSKITDRLFLSNVYETDIWREKNLWDSPALKHVKTFLQQLLED